MNQRSCQPDSSTEVEIAVELTRLDEWSHRNMDDREVAGITDRTVGKESNFSHHQDIESC